MDTHPPILGTVPQIISFLSIPLFRKDGYIHKKSKIYVFDYLIFLNICAYDTFPKYLHIF